MLVIEYVVGALGFPYGCSSQPKHFGYCKAFPKNVHKDVGM